MNFQTICIIVLQLIGLACSILAAYWIPKGSYDNFIQIYPAGAKNIPFRGGASKQGSGITIIPKYENIPRVDDMLKKSKWGYKLLAVGFIIQFVAFALESFNTALAP